MSFKKKWVALVFAGVSSLCLAAEVGQPAPDFTGQGSDGKTYHLSDFKGKLVVLEWTNPGCPFVRKHYESGNMQKLQQQWTAKGVTWLSVISSAPGKEGSVTAGEENTYLKKMKAHPTAALLDPDGVIGHLYGAKTTPHMFVIDQKGILIYAGAIDDKPSVDQDDIKGAENYVAEALTDATAGRPIKISNTNSYGCSIKYKN